MQPPSTIVANERVKAFAGLFFNSGGALAAAAIVKFYTYPVVDLALVLWSITACGLVFLEWPTLSLLEEEQ